jgi:hypothetical protein
MPAEGAKSVGRFTVDLEVANYADLIPGRESQWNRKPV